MLRRFTGAFNWRVWQAVNQAFHLLPRQQCSIPNRERKVVRALAADQRFVIGLVIRDQLLRLGVQTYLFTANIFLTVHIHLQLCLQLFRGCDQHVILGLKFVNTVQQTHHICIV